MTTTSDSAADVDIGELVETDNEQRLVELGAKDLSAEEGEWPAVDLDQALAVTGGVSDRCNARLVSK